MTFACFGKTTSAFCSNFRSLQELSAVMARATTAVLLLYLLLAGWYSLTVPLWEAPDEVAHFRYVQHLRETGRLPVQQVGVLGEAHQPPLYYAVAALASLPGSLLQETAVFRLNPRFTWAGGTGDQVNASLHGSAETFPFRGQALAFRLARAVSLVMGALTVLLIIRSGQMVFPEWPLLGLFAGVWTALNPQFLFISGVLNNDNLLIVATTAVIWQLLRTMRQPESVRGWWLLGLLLAVIALTKITGLAVGGLVGIVLLAVAAARRSWRLLWQGAVAVATPPALLAGWWYVRNWVLYGDLLGMTVYEQVYAANVRQGALRWADVQAMFPVQFRSFWGVFGWMNLPAPDWFFSGMGLVLGTAVVGLLLFAVTGQWRRLRRCQQHGLSLLLLALLMQELVIVTTLTKCDASCYQGRYLFPVMGPLLLLLSVGLLSLPQSLGSLLGRTVGNGRWLALGLGAVGVGTAVFMPLRIIQPAYATPTLAKWQLWTVPQRTNVNFGDMIVLRGYEVDARETGTRVTLYWQAARQPDFDYSAFLHLVDDANAIVAQVDGAPGAALSRLPTSWLPGDIVPDERMLPPLSTLPAGETVRLRAGLYNWATGDRLSGAQSGSAPTDFVWLDVTP